MPIRLVAGIVLGVINALLAMVVSPFLLCLVPVWAFLLGCGSTLATAVLSAALLFLSYASTVSLITNRGQFLPIDYIGGFLGGGMVLFLIAGLASRAHLRLKNLNFLAGLVLGAALIIWSGYWAMPHYRHSYQVSVQASEALADLELYLPIGTVQGVLYTEIFEHPQDTSVQAQVQRSGSMDIVQTEYGTMVKIHVAEFNGPFGPPDSLQASGPTPPLAQPVPVEGSTPQEQYRYAASWIFMHWENLPATPTLTFGPKITIRREMHPRTQEEHVGFVLVEKREALGEFTVPLKVASQATGAKVRIRLYTDTWKRQAVSFGKFRTETYQELLTVALSPSDTWVFVTGNTTRLFVLPRTDT
jgi:hypothetical protein